MHLLAADVYRVLSLNSHIQHTKFPIFKADGIEKIAQIRDQCKREVHDILHGCEKPAPSYSRLLEEQAVPLAFDNDLSDLDRLTYLLENFVMTSVADRREELKHHLPCQVKELIIMYQNFPGKEKSKRLAEETLELINAIRSENHKPEFYY